MSRSAGLLLAAVVVAAVTLAASFASAGAQTDPAAATRPEAAASWLTDQLVDGERLQVTFGSDSFDDPGLTIDAVFAFSAAGVAEGSASTATAWLEESATTSSYVGDGTVESYAGALAKLSLLAQVRGLDPTDWGADDADLVARLQSQEQPSGRFTDVSDFGDFSNSIGQSIAVVMLTRQPGTSASDASLDLLLLSQCADGGFDLALQPAPGTCESGVDTTAYAMQALDAAGRVSDTDEIDLAVSYLSSVQNVFGGFGTAAGEQANTNSTGLAAQALRVLGVTNEADAGVAFLESLQVECDGAAADRGGISFDAGGFDAATAPRATAQAVLGLVGVGYATLTSTGSADTTQRFICELPPPSSSGTSTSTVTVPTSGVLVGVLTQTPSAVPVKASPSFTG